jgi:hypothetical protein
VPKSERANLVDLHAEEEQWDKGSKKIFYEFLAEEEGTRVPGEHHNQKRLSEGS